MKTIQNTQNEIFAKYASYDEEQQEFLEFLEPLMSKLSSAPIQIQKQSPIEKSLDIQLRPKTPNLSPIEAEQNITSLREASQTYLAPQRFNVYEKFKNIIPQDFMTRPPEFRKNIEKTLIKDLRKGDDEARKQLLNLYQPLIKKRANQWATPAIPQYLLETEMERNINQSIETYKPDSNATLFTYINSRLPAVNRYVYNHQNTGRIPVNRIANFGQFQSAIEELTEKYGRKPDDVELADHLKWNLPEVKRLRNEMRKDLADFSFTETPLFSTLSSDDDEFAFLLYFELNDREKEVYNRLLGQNGHKAQSTKDVAASMKISPSMVVKIKNQILKKAEQYKR